MNRFKGKVIVITGGTSGIGLATAQAFVAEGADVYITGRRQTELDRAAATLGSHVYPVRADASINADLDALYQQVDQRHGHIDVVFANAGFLEMGPLGALKEEQYHRQFDTNVKGVLFTVQAALSLMVAGGAIVLNGSISGSMGTPASSLYGASKAAVRSFARSWAQDLKGRDIRVNVVSPGPTHTNVLEAGGFSADQVTQAKNYLAGTIPLGRMGEASEVASAVLFLASSESSFMTGSELFVDGGMAQV